MKKILTFLIMIVSVVPAIHARDIYTQDVNSLPAAARTTLNKYFGKKKVNHIKIDRGVVGGDDYDVILSDGTEIEFDSKGQIKEVDTYNGVPNGLMPNIMTKYIKDNFKNAKVVKLEVDRRSYEVELNNGIELIFDRAGNFKRMDH